MQITQYKLILFFSIVFFAVSNKLIAQQEKNTLLIKKEGNIKKRFFYKTRDYIILKAGEPSFYVKGNIQEIRDTALVIDGFVVEFSNINTVYRQRYITKLFNSRKLYLAAAGTLVGSAINNASIGEDKLLYPHQIALGTGFLGLGILSNKFNYRKMNTNKWRFFVLKSEINYNDIL